MKSLSRTGVNASPQIHNISRKSYTIWKSGYQTITPPLWASTWEMMACHLVALHKATWVHLVGIGEFIRLLLAKCFLLLTGATETDVYGNFDLCSG